MEYPKIDETKLPAVKELIDEINHYVVDQDCDEKSPEIQALSQKLREVTGNEKLDIAPLMYYSSYTTLESAAMMALMPMPQKCGLSDEEIGTLVGKMINAELLIQYGEAVNDYFLEVLKLETGLDDITDYIYNPDEIGMNIDASEEEIIERILTDKK